MSPTKGSLCIVLHSHIPYVRGSGPWPHGEVWLYEAMAETYIPLLIMLRSLAKNHLPVRLTLCLTPILLDQLADTRVQNGFTAYLAERAGAADADHRYFERTGQTDLQWLAGHHVDFYRDTRRAFKTTFSGDLVSAFADLQDDGVVEIATSAATHGYLPLLGDASVGLQLSTAVAGYERHFARSPQVVWLPECGYRAGLEAQLETRGLRLFFAETFMVTGGMPTGVADQGPFGAYPSAWASSGASSESPGPLRSPHRAYLVDDSDVAVIGRDARTGSQVWSGASGYPGDGAYREFHKQSARSGLRYWRVTDHSLPLDAKQLYDRELAGRRVLAHANHFIGLVREELQTSVALGDEAPVLAAAYDTELFGHWWAEGVAWLDVVLRRTATAGDIDLVSGLDYIDAHPPRGRVAVADGSWGVGGGHHVWNNQSNAWIWPIINAAEARLADIVSKDPQDAVRKELLDQAARELLLMESSDWPFLMTGGQASEFAGERFRLHLARFDQCMEACLQTSPDPSLVKSLWEVDSVFPDIDSRWIAA